MQAVILAGGAGTRLRPYTTILPKSLMPIGERAILEVIVLQLKQCGITHLFFTVGYLGELIEAYFGNGEKWGVRIEYSREKEPLGTAGPVTLIKKLDSNFLVMNGDVLCDLNFKDLMRKHIKDNNMITICSYTKTVKIDLGVLEFVAGKLIDYIEKPEYSFRVSMGVYAMNRLLVKRMAYGKYCNFPELIKDQLKDKIKIGTYNFSGKWYDIGRVEDYQLACSEFMSKPETFLSQK